MFGLPFRGKERIPEDGVPVALSGQAESESTLHGRRGESLMAKKIINIRLEDSVWQQAKVSAARDGCTLQEWVTFAILAKVEQGDKQVPAEATIG